MILIQTKVGKPVISLEELSNPTVWFPLNTIEVQESTKKLSPLKYYHLDAQLQKGHP